MTTRKFEPFEVCTPSAGAKTPLISIGMPVRNCGKTLAMAVQSILWQSRADWELLIVDDGSTDKTVEIARGFRDPRIRVFADGMQRGLSARLNEAVALSTGEYFARMDGDDIAYPERFERQISFLGANPQVDLLGTGILVFRGDGKAMGTRAVLQTHSEICRRPWAGFYLPHPTWMAKTTWFREHPYREQAVRMEDQDVLLRAYESSTFASLPQILLGYREDTFALGKALAGRYNFIKTLAFEPRSQHNNHGIALRGVVEHGLKAMAEIFAAGTGLNYRILRHRARPVDRMALERWRQLWSQLRDVGLETTEAASTDFEISRS